MSAPKRFAMATRAVDAEGYRSDQEAAAAGRKHQLMLNGPVATGDGNAQHHVDFLLGEEKPTVSQSEIDKLFA